MTYEISFRKRVLKYIGEGNSITKTSKLFGISDKTIQKWKKMQENDSLEDSVRNRSFRKIDPAALKAYVLEHPDAYLSEVAEVFQCATSSIHEALDKLGLVRKKKTKSYGEQDQKKLKHS